MEHMLGTAMAAICALSSVSKPADTKPRLRVVHGAQKEDERSQPLEGLRRAAVQLGWQGAPFCSPPVDAADSPQVDILCKLSV